MLLISGEEEITARTAGLSTLIIVSTLVPLLGIIIIIMYHHVQRKNIEIAEKQKLMHFEELDRERQKILDKIQRDRNETEKKINEYLENRLNEEPRPSTSGTYNPRNISAPNIIHIDSDVETDDEFFEMPLPPIPTKSPRSVVSTGQISIIDNEAVGLDSPSSKWTYFETPKIQNKSESFRFPSRFAPPPPINIESNDEDETDKVKEDQIEREPNNIPHDVKDEDAQEIIRRSSQPIIVGVIPKVVLESEI